MKKWQNTCNCMAQFNNTWQRVDTEEEAGEHCIKVENPDEMLGICPDCGKEVVKVMCFRNLYMEK